MLHKKGFGRAILEFETLIAHQTTHRSIARFSLLFGKAGRGWL